MEKVGDIVEQLGSLRDYLRWTISRMEKAGVYYGHGTDNALDEALALLLPLLSIPADQQELWLDAVLTPGERHQLVAAVSQRVEQRIPVPHIIGEAWFAGLPFTVNPQVLIPRSPIAELVLNGFQPWLQGPVERVLDLCTGSGCIGIACAMVFDDASVELADLSPEALQVAGSNISRHRLEKRVSVVQSDLFAALDGRRYELIVSNPPYVDARDLAEMPAEYHHEPGMALAAGEDGLDLVRSILREAEHHLTDHGVLIVEVGNSWVALEQAYSSVPFTWLEFEHGGHGVFVLSKQELQQYREQFQ